MTTGTGSESTLQLAARGRELAPHCLQIYDIRLCHEWMLRAADALERLAPYEPDIEVVRSET